MKEITTVDAISALKDILFQIVHEGWTIPVNDRGSGSAGVRFVDDAEIIERYLKFATSGDNKDVPSCQDISYISVKDFSEEENEIIDEILNYADFIERKEIIGLVVIDEEYDCPYTFYIPHISEI